MTKLFAFLALVTLASSAFAMGGSPPEKKEEPKYKLEILKMELVTAPAQTLEATKEGDSKYKLEILKMDMITAPSPSWEGKKE